MSTIRPIECAQCEEHSKTIDALLAERASLTAEVAALKKQLAESEEGARNALQMTSDEGAEVRAGDFEDGIKTAVTWLREADIGPLYPGEDPREAFAGFIEAKARAAQ